MINQHIPCSNINYFYDKQAFLSQKYATFQNVITTIIFPLSVFELRLEIATVFG